MQEREAVESEVFDELIRGRVAFDHEEFVRQRRDDFGLGHVFAGQRFVVERAVAGQEPFARRVEETEGVLEDELGVFAPGVPGLHAFAAGDEGFFLFVHAVEEAAGVVPVVIDDEVHVLEFGGREAGRTRICSACGRGWRAGR